MPGEQLFINRPLPGARLDMSHPLAKGLVGCWLMNEQGNIAYDLSPYKNHGSLVNFTSPLYSLGQRSIQGIKFDGIDSYIDCGSANSLNLLSDFTLSTWIYITSIGTITGTVGTRTDRNDFTLPYGLIVSATNIPLFRMGNGASQSSCDSTVVLNQSVWYNITASIKGTIMKLYQNGILIKSATYGGTRQTLSKLTIGSRSTSANFFYGHINNVMIWNTALSEHNIKNLYISPYSPGGKNMFI